MLGLLSAWRTPLFVVTLAVSAMTAAGYTLAAGNTVPATKAGEAGTAISGYTISNVVYTLAVGNPQQIASLTFNVDQVLPATAKIHVRLQDPTPGPAGPWYACTNVPPSLTVNCAGMAAAVETADELRVVIVQ
jgi:hypothetical protein